MPHSIDFDAIGDGPTISAATVHYRHMLARRTPAEIHTLSHIKRFMERLVGDLSFRVALGENLDNPRPVVEGHGIDIDPKEMLPLWHSAYLRYRRTPECRQWPLAVLWDEYMGEMLHHRDMLRDSGDMTTAHPRFHAWRERQILRCNSELGGTGGSVTHPVISFELSEGCSVGCWFCGIAADRFKGYYAYTDDNAALWRNAVTHARELLGQAVQTGFCYWATDPCDNPDYDRFLLDYYNITGALPQTTTAAPLKNEALTRRVMDLFNRYRTVTNRFSVLTLRQLNQIHAAFTPEELMGVELVMQQKEALTTKAKAGRAEVRREKLRDAGKPDQISLVEQDHTTIACVSGFLVNMVKGQIQLATPVPGSKRWPLGYRVVGERTFKTGEEFRQGLESLIDAHMQIGMPADRPVRFRSDLKYCHGEENFTLESRAQRHIIGKGAGVVALGDLIARGTATPGELVTQAATLGTDVFRVAGLLDQLFDDGLLEEDFDDTFAGRQNEGLLARAAAVEKAFAASAANAGSD
jgi:radical SAM family RiPP maturation amino acid epimerase